MIKNEASEITDRSEAMLEDFRARYEREGRYRIDSMVFHPLRTVWLTVEGSTRLDVIEGHWAMSNQDCCALGAAGPTTIRNINGVLTDLPPRINLP